MYRIFSLENTQKSPSTMAEIRSRLENNGYEFISCANQRMSLTEIKAQRPDLILLDPSTGEIDGFEVCQALKKDPETENIPVIFIRPGLQGGTSTPSSDVAQGFESGASDLISIEVDEIEMMARMKAAIRSNRALSQSTALAEQLNKMNTELYERNLQVEKELYVARQLQQSLLPPFIKEEEVPGTEGMASFSKCHYKEGGLKISGVYLPCDALGGDIYDVLKFPNGDIGVTIADVSGHGVPAGFITAIFKSSFYRCTHNHSAANDILYHLNNELADIVKTGEYVTALYCRLTENDGQPNAMNFEFSGAGHPYPLYYCAKDDSLTRLKENGTPLVWVKNMQYPCGNITLQPGDKVLLFTDGVSEMRNVHGELYSEELLEEAFLQLNRDKHPRLLDGLIERLSDFTEGHPLEDDVSVVPIEMQE